MPIVINYGQAGDLLSMAEQAGRVGQSRWEREFEALEEERRRSQDIAQQQIMAQRRSQDIQTSLAYAQLRQQRQTQQEEMALRNAAFNANQQQLLFNAFQSGQGLNLEQQKLHQRAKEFEESLAQQERLTEARAGYYEAGATAKGGMGGDVQRRLAETYKIADNELKGLMRQLDNISDKWGDTLVGKEDEAEQLALKITEAKQNRDAARSQYDQWLRTDTTQSAAVQSRLDRGNQGVEASRSMAIEQMTQVQPPSGMTNYDMILRFYMNKFMTKLQDAQIDPADVKAMLEEVAQRVWQQRQQSGEPVSMNVGPMNYMDT